MNFHLRFLTMLLATATLALSTVGAASPRAPRPSRFTMSVGNLPASASIVEQDVRVTCQAAESPRCAYDMKLSIANTATEAVEVQLTQWLLLPKTTWSIEGSESSASSVKIPANERAVVHVRGDLTFENVEVRGTRSDGWGGVLRDPIHIRHFLLAKPSTQRKAFLPVLAPSPKVTLVAPEKYDMAHELGGEIAFFTSVVPSPLPRTGGPFIGIGAGASAKEKSVETKLRVGYEIARPSWLIESIAVESDFRRLVIAPVVEASLSGGWSQAVSLGVGAPVRVTKDVNVGVRAQFALQFPFVGIVTTVDVFPGLPRGENVIPSVYGQVSF